MADSNLINTFIVCASAIAVLYVLLRKYGKIFSQWVHAGFVVRTLHVYHAAMRGMKQVHFSSMAAMKSADPELQSKGVVRVLEIGAGQGANFEFFPGNCRLTVVEPNSFFKQHFFANQAKYPTVKMDRFVVGTAEDMKEIEDNSIDIVVSTLVLCSVTNPEKSLQEIKRVLAPGGRYYYWDHVHDTPGTWLHTIQSALSWCLWPTLFDGCHLNRNIDVAVSAAGFSTVEQQRFILPKTIPGKIWGLVKVHVRGVATK